jgi:hypothetical protein
VDDTAYYERSGMLKLAREGTVRGRLFHISSTNRGETVAIALKTYQEDLAVMKEEEEEEEEEVELKSRDATSDPSTFGRSTRILN